MIFRAWLVMLTVWIAIIAGATRASAAPIAEIVRIDWGWGGSLVAARWSPVWVTIQAGLEPVRGEVTIAYDQDLSQRAALRSPFALSPAQRTTVMIPVCSPRQLTEAIVTLEAASPSDTLRGEITCSPFRQGLESLPPVLGSLSITIGVLGDVSGPDESTGQKLAQSLWANDDPAMVQRFAPRVIRLDTEQLPLMSAALRSLDVLVVRAEVATSIEPRRRAVIRQWILGGGRLIVVANQPGPAWTQWVPEFMTQPEWLTLTEPQSLATWPADFAQMYSNTGIDPQAAARLIRLGVKAKADGWSARWRAGNDAALGVRGPVGFGFVTVLGVDLSRFAKTVGQASTAESIRTTWSALLLDILPCTQSTGSIRAEMLGSPGAQSVTTALDQVVTVPPVGTDMAWAAFIIVGLLALLLGPVDYFVLGWLRARQRSWLSACLWIALASLAALVLPSALRSSGSAASNLVVMDHLMPSDDRSPGLVWTTTLTTLFADGAMRADWEPRPAGTVVHGVSIESMRVSATSLPTLPLEVRSASLDVGRDPWGGFAQSGPDGNTGDGSIVPDPRPQYPTNLRRWSLRCVAEDARAQSPLKAWTTASDHSTEVVHLSGLDPEAEVIALQINTGDGTRPGRLARSAEGWQIIVDQRDAERPSNPRWSVPEAPSTLTRQRYSVDALAEAAAGLALADGRLDAIERRTREGNRLQLRLLVREAPSIRPGFGPAQSHQCFTLHRISVPRGRPSDTSSPTRGDDQENRP